MTENRHTPEYDTYVRAVADAAPPLRPEQLAKLQTLFSDAR
jgi:hypothetical protein